MLLPLRGAKVTVHVTMTQTMAHTCRASELPMQECVCIALYHLRGKGSEAHQTESPCCSRQRNFELTIIGNCSHTSNQCNLPKPINDTNESVQQRHT